MNTHTQKKTTFILFDVSYPANVDQFLLHILTNHNTKQN